MKLKASKFIMGLGGGLILLISMTTTTYLSGREILPPENNLQESLTMVKTFDQPIRTLLEDTQPSTTIIEGPIEPSRISDPISKSPYRDLLKRNLDYRGWISIEGSNISYPIVKGLDNNYYLKRSFDQEYDTKGSIFMDYRNLGFGISQHIILYGHNMKDGSMFADLKKYKDPSYALSNSIIQIEDLYGIRYFKVYASYYASAESDLIQTSFMDDDDYQAFINQQVARSSVNYNLIPSEEAYTLTLVTCSYEVDDGRYFLHTVEIPSP